VIVADAGSNPAISTIFVVGLRESASPPLGRLRAAFLFGASMDPIALTYTALRIAATWHLAYARMCLRAAGELGPLPQCEVVRMEVRR